MCGCNPVSDKGQPAVKSPDRTTCGRHPGYQAYIEQCSRLAKETAEEHRNRMLLEHATNAGVVDETAMIGGW